MIRQSLPAIKAATYCILLPNQATTGALFPTGTGFLVSRDGLLITSRHVITEEGEADGTLRNDLDQAMLATKSSSITPVNIIRTIDDVLAEDIPSDFALLRTQPSSPSMGVNIGEPEPAPLEISVRQLDDGEPIYAFGYPLGDFDYCLCSGI